MDNSPHVPFFRPIVQKLKESGCMIILTARNAFQVKDLAQLYGLECEFIGKHYGKSKLMKVAGLFVRSSQLLPTIAKQRPRLAISHGSRAQMMVAKWLRIPSVVLADYEHVTHLTRPDWIVVPEAISKDIADKLASIGSIHYPGLKEDVYAAGFSPDESIVRELGLDIRDIIVTVRPPATEAHYHNNESDDLFAAAMNLLGKAENVRTVVLPRNPLQERNIRRRWQGLFETRRMVIPTTAVDGLNLVWHSDLVISGGGTMNREAAALGVPVYSIFRGKLGAVDKYLKDNGRLVMLNSPGAVGAEIKLVKRAAETITGRPVSAALDKIVDSICYVADKYA
jgi:hypothetical protein